MRLPSTDGKTGNTMHKKVFIKTFGCQMNEYDSGKMADLLEATDGYIRTDKAEEADLILLNTCSVREKAQEKVFSDLGRINKRLRKNKSDLIIGVSGCVASQEGEAIVRRAPYVNIVFGPQTLHRLPKMIHEYEKTGQAQIDTSFPEIEKFDHLPRHAWKCRPPMYPSWKVAANSAAIASSPTPVAPRCPARWKTYSSKWLDWLNRA